MSGIFDPLTLKQKIKFFRSYKQFLKYFPEASVNRELDKIKPANLVEEYQQPHTDWAGRPLNFNDPTYLGDAVEPLGTRHTHYTFHKDGWTRSAPVICTCWKVPAKFQGLVHGKMLKALLIEAKPFLQNFGMDCYELGDDSNRCNEFYVSLGGDAEGHTCLYVPYVALLANDIDAIKKRNKDYFESYNRQKDIWGVMKEMDAVKCFFENMLAWEGK